MKAFCAGIMEMACRLRPMDMFLMDLAMNETEAVALMSRIMELKAAYWTTALDELGDLVDVITEADDFGTQESMLIRPEMYRRLIKPLRMIVMRMTSENINVPFFFISPFLLHVHGTVAESASTVKYNIIPVRGLDMNTGSPPAIYACLRDI